MSTLTTRDLVPEALRCWWRHIGHYPGSGGGLRGVRTYRELHDAALRLAGSLADQGLRPGEVIAVQLPNGWRAVAVDLAAAALGAVVLPYPVGRGTGTRSRCCAIPGPRWPWSPSRTGRRCYG